MKLKHGRRRRWPHERRHLHQLPPHSIRSVGVPGGSVPNRSAGRTAPWYRDQPKADRKSRWLCEQPRSIGAREIDEALGPSVSRPVERPEASARWPVRFAVGPQHPEHRLDVVGHPQVVVRQVANDRSFCLAQDGIAMCFPLARVFREWEVADPWVARRGLRCDLRRDHRRPIADDEDLDARFGLALRRCEGQAEERAVIERRDEDGRARSRCGGDAAAAIAATRRTMSGIAAAVLGCVPRRETGASRPAGPQRPVVEIGRRSIASGRL